MLDKSQLSPPVATANVNAQEIARFDALADAWWILTENIKPRCLSMPPG